MVGEILRISVSNYNEPLVGTEILSDDKDSSNISCHAF